MRKLFIILSVILLFITACGNGADEKAYEVDDAYESEGQPRDSYDDPDDAELVVIYEYEDVHDISEAIYALAEFASYYFGRLQEAWDDDNGEMWGVRLHTPVIIFCWDTNATAANYRDPEGEFERLDIDGVVVYVGERPHRFISFYRHDWGDRTGIFKSYQMMTEPGWVTLGVYWEDRSAVSLLQINHYVMHILQPEIMGVHGADMQYGVARTNYILEITALVHAINSSGDERVRAVHDALSIRNERREIYDTGINDNLITLSEGTAIYTELHMVLNRYEIERAIQNWPRWLVLQRCASQIATTYGYMAGALYGMLLDAFEVDWRSDIQYDTDLGLLLQEALGITEFIPLDRIDLERYGYSEIVASYQ